MKSVSYIFDGEARVKIMRLFIFNPEQRFSISEIAKRSKERPHIARREVRILAKSGLVRPRLNGFILNHSCKYLGALEAFLVDAAPVTEKDIIKKLSGVGNIKMILISGIFLHDRESRVDMLIVGDHIKHAKLLRAISSIEALLGKELRYAAFETVDFQYRLSLYDKLIRDILDFRHEKILNKLGI